MKIPWTPSDTGSRLYFSSAENEIILRAPPENEPEVPQQQPPHAAEVPQQQAPHDDIDVADKHQTDTSEVEGPETDTHDPAGAHTPDTALGPPSEMDMYATMTLPQHQL